MPAPTRILGCILVVVLCAAGAEKPQTWIEVRSPHFLVVSDAKEKQARRVAKQFELIRAVFQKSFPRTRVDPVGPVTVLAAKDERSLKALLPAFWEEKGHLQPAGIFVKGPEKNYVALRVDVSSADAYHTIYHEYAHMLLSLNIPWLPTWLDEGIAEVYGNSHIGEKEVELGRPSSDHVALLRRSNLLPLDVLFAVDQSSPHYNEAHKASIFYAQSWALTHLLMFGDRMQHNQKLVEFAGLLGKGVEQQEALRRTLGDLKALDRQLEAYVRRTTMPYARIEAPSGIEEEEFVVREISPAESAAVRGDFHLHNKREVEGRTLLEEALRLDPNVALAHESMGFLLYRLGEKEEAEKWFAEAVQLDSRSYLAHYYFAILTAQDTADPESIALAESSLRRALELNPEFAFASAALAGFYAAHEERIEEARRLARRAVELEPAVVSHYLTLGNILLRMDNAQEAKAVGQRAMRVAKSADESRLVTAFLGQVRQFEQFQAAREREEQESRAARQEWERVLEEERKAALERGSREQAGAGSVVVAGETPGGGLRAAVEGKIVELSCTPRGELKLTLDLPSYKLELHADDYQRIEFLPSDPNTPSSFDPCKHLRGMKARITYAIGEPHAGEIASIELRK